MKIQLEASKKPKPIFYIGIALLAIGFIGFADPLPTRTIVLLLNVYSTGTFFFLAIGAGSICFGWGLFLWLSALLKKQWIAALIVLGLFGLVVFIRTSYVNFMHTAYQGNNDYFAPPADIEKVVLDKKAPSDWKTYVSPQCDFSFSYPANWTITSSISNSDATFGNRFTVNATDPGSIKQTADPMGFICYQSIDDVAKLYGIQAGLQDFSQLIKQFNGLAVQRNEKIKTADINGEQFYIITEFGDAKYWAEKNGHIYSITPPIPWPLDRKDYKTPSSTIDVILSSFKFEKI